MTGCIQVMNDGLGTNLFRMRQSIHEHLQAHFSAEVAVDDVTAIENKSVPDDQQVRSMKVIDIDWESFRSNANALLPRFMKVLLSISPQCHVTNPNETVDWQAPTVLCIATVSVSPSP